MALTHTTAVRNGLADYIDTTINGGGGAGKLIIMAAADAVLATITLNATAFGAASSGTITLAGVPLSDSSADGTGTAIAFKFVDFADTEVFRGSVTATSGGGDIELTSTSITATDTVTITSFTYTAST
jgi:hypothetical protein